MRRGQRVGGVGGREGGVGGAALGLMQLFPLTWMCLCGVWPLARLQENVTSLATKIIKLSEKHSLDVSQFGGRPCHSAKPGHLMRLGDVRLPNLRPQRHQRMCVCVSARPCRQIGGGVKVARVRAVVVNAAFFAFDARRLSSIASPRSPCDARAGGDR